jgi:NTE family protein
MVSIKSLFRSGRNYETGIILSGGGARGFAHAGILKALNEAGIFPDIIAGVSAGAVVGALYADGYSPDEIYEIFAGERSFFKYVKLTVPAKGLFKTVGLKKNLASHLRAKTFSELRIPLIVAATNLNQGKIEYFSSGEVLPAVMASAAIPVLFEPVEINGNIYVDGGVLDNFPVSPLEGECNRIIGIYLNPIHPENDFHNMIKIAERTFHLSVSSNLYNKMEMCDLVIEPGELGKYGLLDASAGKEMFELGYRAASEKLNSSGI